MYTLRQARVGMNLTQQDIATKMGVHVQTYARMEKHPEDMTMKEAAIFSDIVKLPIEELIFLPNNSN